MMCNRVVRDIQVEEAVKIAREDTGYINFIDKNDPHVYEWDLTEPLMMLEDAEEIFAVMRR